MPVSRVKLVPKSIPKSPPLRTAQPETWLDYLPLEINFRIATFLTSGLRDDRDFDHSIDNLRRIHAFAGISASLKQAYTDALRNTVYTPKAASYSNALGANILADHIADTVNYFRDLFYNDVREVRLPEHIPCTPALRELLALPSIKRVSMPNHRDFVIALVAGASVTHLVLYLDPLLERLEHASMHLSELLRQVPLEYLQLCCFFCLARIRSNCNISRYLAFIQNHEYPTLTTFNIKCRNIPSFINASTNTTNLEKLILESWGVFRAENGIPIETHDYLRNVPSLNLRNCGPVSLLSPLLRQNLTALSSKSIVSRSDVRALRNCSNLQSIELVLPRGVECFPENLLHLRCITLSWTRQPSCLSAPTDYYTTTPGALADLISRNERLEELRLCNVVLSRSELQVVLSCIGANLRVLEVPILYQGELPMHRLSFLIRHIVSHNRNLSDLYLPSSHTTLHLFIPHSHKEGTCSSRGCEFCRMRSFVDFVIPVLKRRLPYFRDAAITRLRTFQSLFN